MIFAELGAYSHASRSPDTQRGIKRSASWYYAPGDVHDEMNKEVSLIIDCEEHDHKTVNFVYQMGDF